MQIINLSHAEAADPAVVTSVLRLTGTGLTLIDGSSGEIMGKQVTPSAGTIAPADRPDAGVDVVQQVAFVPPVGVVPPVPGAVDTAALFGGQPAASAAPLAAVVTPPSAAIVPAAVLSAAAAVPGGAAVANGSPATPAVGVVVDSKGHPWDARIHAANKATKQDGTWKAKKGVNDDAFVAKINAENMAALAAMPAAASGAAPVSSAVPLPPTVPAAPQPSTPAPAVAAAPIASPSSAPVAPAAPAAVTFQTLMAKLAPFMASGKLTPAKQAEVFQQFDLPSLAGLMQRPDLVPAMAVVFDSVLAELG